MRKISYILGFALLVLLMQNQVHAADERIGSYNLGSGTVPNSDIATWSADTSTGSSYSRALAVSKQVIANSSISGLQESGVGINRLSVLCKVFNDSSSKGRWKFVVEGRTDGLSQWNKSTQDCAAGQVNAVRPVSYNSSRFTHNIIVYDSTKFDYNSGGIGYYSLQFSNNKNNYGYTWAKLTYKANKKPILFINTHIAGEGVAAGAPVNQLGQLINAVYSYRVNHGNKNIFVVGDFNLNYYNSSQKKNIDSFRSGRTSADQMSCSPAAGGASASTYKINGKQTSKIDYACASAHLRPNTINKKVGPQNLFSYSGKQYIASDHYMVSNNFNFSALK